MSFSVTVPGKWVLAGEHAVLRGQPAVALPLPDRSLRLSYVRGGDDALEIHPAEARELLFGLVDAFPRARPGGRLHIESDIPIGAGLGSSAALCVAVTRWLGSSAGQMSATDEFTVARRLEDRFHGKSSGMDIAVILAGRPIFFAPGETPRVIEVARTPRFTFHDTGLRAKTRECVERVEAMRACDALGAGIDLRMGQAAWRGREGLELYGAGENARGVRLIAESMNEAQACFEAWGLVPEPAARLIEELRAGGASAAKLTGAGAGGMVVALWPTERARRVTPA